MRFAFARIFAGFAITTCAAAVLAQASASTACGAKADALPRITLLTPQRGQLASGETACFRVVLRKGELVRVAVEADAGYLRARLLDPPRQNNQLQVTWAWSFFPSLPLVLEAPRSGSFVIELHVPPRVEVKESLGFRVHLIEYLSAKQQAARVADLRSDPRSAWLRRNVVPIRSIAPEDEDYSDLQFLREELRDVRVVLLGEGDHGGGSDFKAKTRLIKFLHQQMGFDVLAFEAGLFSAQEAWAALQTEAAPRDSFLKGVFGLLGRSQQVQPLIEYLHASARSDRPLEIVGFDSQFSGTVGNTIVARMREFLEQHRVATSLTDQDSRPRRIFEGVLDRRFAQKREALPDQAEQEHAVQALRAAAAEVERTVPGEDGSLWGQVLRSSAVQLGLFLDNLRNPTDSVAYGSGRDRQMAENLVWLVNTRFPKRKVIVWAHTFHVMRKPEATTPGKRQGFTMGEGLWKALGAESFSIALTSYRGTTHWLTLPDGFDQDVIADQHPSLEFEELMDTAGHEFAYVNLRNARARGEWLGGPFVASLLYLMPELAAWSDTVDAILFIRTQEPSRRFDAK